MKTPKPDMKEVLKALIEAKKKTAFIPEAQASVEDPQALGIMISQYFEWDGLEILKTLYAALEDANFHAENRVIAEMIEKLEKQVA